MIKNVWVIRDTYNILNRITHDTLIFMNFQHLHGQKAEKFIFTDFLTSDYFNFIIWLNRNIILFFFLYFALISSNCQNMLYKVTCTFTTDGKNSFSLLIGFIVTPQALKNIKITY